MTSAPTTPRPAVLRVRGLSAGYAQRAGLLRGADAMILERFDYDFGPGVHGIQGPNGSGKSTLLKAIIDPRARTAGTVELDGKPLHPRQIAYVPQSVSRTLGPWRTVLEEAALALTIAGVPRRDRRAVVERRMRDLGLKLPLDRRVASLSGGQSMATAILRAACVPSDRRVWVLDEPTEGLDARTRAGILRTIKRLSAAEAMPVLIVSHRASDLTRMGARLLDIERLRNGSHAAHAESPAGPAVLRVADSKRRRRARRSAGAQSGDVLSSATRRPATLRGLPSWNGPAMATAGLVGGLAVWAAMAATIDNPSLLPAPSGVLRELSRMATDADLRSHLAATTARFVGCWAASGAAGLTAGVLIGYVPATYQLLAPWLLLARSMPLFALLGVAAGLFPQRPEWQRSFLVILSLFALAVQTISAGAAFAPRGRMQYARLLGARPVFLLRHVLWQEIRGTRYAALELTLPMACVLTLVIELFLIPTYGLGGLVYNHFNDRNLSPLFAALIAPGLIVVVMIYALRVVRNLRRNDDR